MEDTTNATMTENERAERCLAAMIEEEKPKTLDERLAWLAVAQHGYALLARISQVSTYLHSIDDAPLTDEIDRCLIALEKALVEAIQQMMRELNAHHGIRWMDDYLPDDFCSYPT